MRSETNVTTLANVSYLVESSPADDHIQSAHMGIKITKNQVKSPIYSETIHLRLRAFF